MMCSFHFFINSLVFLIFKIAVSDVSFLLLFSLGFYVVKIPLLARKILYRSFVLLSHGSSRSGSDW